jgi:hypothetical protein
MLIAMMSSLLVLVKLKEPHLNRTRRGREGGLEVLPAGRSTIAAPRFSVAQSEPEEVPGMGRERRLEARQVEEIFLAFAEAMRELPPDIEAGWLDAQGDLRLAPDIARKLRTARRVRQLLVELRQSQSEG